MLVLVNAQTSQPSAGDAAQNSADARVQKLANCFGKKLLNVIGAVLYKAAVDLNSREEDPAICHSHDYCDANVVMAEAFAEVVGREIDLQSDEDTALWNQGWALWKKNVASQITPGRAALETPTDVLRDFATAVWSDCRLPGDMRKDLECVYHTVVVPLLRQSAKGAKAHAFRPLHVERPFREPGVFISDDLTALVARLYPDQEHYAPLFAVAPKLITALTELVGRVQSSIEWHVTQANRDGSRLSSDVQAQVDALDAARAVITEARGGKPAAPAKVVEIKFDTREGRHLLKRSTRNGTPEGLEDYFCGATRLYCSTSEREDWESATGMSADADELDAETFASLADFLQDNHGLKLFGLRAGEGSL